MDKKTAQSLVDVLEGQRILGGCLDCSAYQTIEQPDDQTIKLNVFHDLDCPYYNGVTK